MEQQLSTSSEILYSDSGSENKINVNDGLNDFLQHTALYLKILSPDVTDYCVDFDHQFIPTEKYDSTYSYKNKRGYFPATASIDNIPVYIENRNGNCQVQFNQLSTIKRCFTSLKEKQIRLSSARMDSGSYIKEVTDYLQQEHVTFYIRAERSDSLIFQAATCDNWHQATIGIQEYQVASIDYAFGKHTHRMVCYRQKNKTGQTNLITGDDYHYMFIITNDREKTEQQIIAFYNARGNSERLFDIQNNDFNWKYLPSSQMEYNTVYMIIMAVAHIIYRWLINLLSETYKFLEPHYRIKKFIFRFICVVAKITHSGRRHIIHLFVKNRMVKLTQLSP